MNSANINDPTAVKALLDQLGASQVWRDTLNSSPVHTGGPDTESPANAQENVQDEFKARSSDIAPSTSVASLLSQLRTSEQASTTTNTQPLSNTCTTHQLTRNISRSSPPTQVEHRNLQPVSATSTRVQDIRSMSFQQALSHLTQLASDPEFLTAVSRLRQEQDELEQKLWDERLTLHKKHEEKVKIARTKATLIGAGLSKHEAEMMNDAYRQDLQRFDSKRVLMAWDALIQKQQEALETLGVPTMFATTSQADCQKQRKVIQVLEGL